MDRLHQADTIRSGVMSSINRLAGLPEGSYEEPTWKEFMRLSRRFTVQTDLASSWVIDAIEAVEVEGGMAI